MKRHILITLLGIIAFLLGGCDQSVNYTGLVETRLTGKYCEVLCVYRGSLRESRSP